MWCRVEGEIVVVVRICGVAGVKSVNKTSKGATGSRSAKTHHVMSFWEVTNEKGLSEVVCCWKR